MKNIVYLLLGSVFLLSACNGDNSKPQLMNDKAALPSSFKFDGLGLNVMASFINKRSGTMSTLYANQLALQNAIKGVKVHAAGEVMALVTWKQQDDDHWFGAKIPGNVQTVELIKTVASSGIILADYKKYSGKNLFADVDTLQKKERIAYIFEQQPSVMP